MTLSPRQAGRTQPPPTLLAAFASALKDKVKRQSSQVLGKPSFEKQIESAFGVFGAAPKSGIFREMDARTGTGPRLSDWLDWLRGL